MGGWKEENLSEIMEYPFDFERYIEERLREIDDLDERQFAKKVLLEGLGKVIRCTEAKYQQLERRIFQELTVEDDQFEAVVTVINRDHYDPTNGTLFPVFELDLDEAGLSEALSDEHQVFLGTIFLETDEKTQRIFEKETDWNGTLSKDGEKQDVLLKIRPAQRYRNTMERLYQIFQDNHIPWKTINTACQDKFYDVFIRRESLKAVSVKPALHEIDIAFGEFQDYVRYGRMPLWNLEWVEFDSADFMVPCLNGIYYEHEFTLADKDANDGYLLEFNEDIFEIRHEKKKIIIKSKRSTFENWKALHIVQAETVRSLDYSEPLLSNHKKDSFIRRFAENSQTQLMTKTDLFRRIMELDIAAFIEVIGYEICENAKDYPNVEGMNWFVRDELFPMESRKVLLLKFREKQPGGYLNDGLVRFVISQLQLEISEYRCVGVIV